MYKNNKFTLILPTVVAVSIAVGILLGGVVFKNTPPVPRRGNLVAPGSGKLNMLLSLIENRYVDTVSMDSITEKTIPFILEELDPHSVYVPAKDMAQMNESLDGEFDGIGVMFNMATDTVIVLNVINSVEFEGRRAGRRPHHHDQRHGSSGREDAAGRSDETASGPARQ